jgi:hypothetical protein
MGSSWTRKHQQRRHDRAARGMGDVVNLRRARKSAERSLQQQSAAANRLKHGRSKAERELDAMHKAKTRRDLDQHRLDTGDER